MSDPAVNQQASSLRAELKEWERAFSAANGGRKAGKDDIKKDPVIAAKYKAYSRLRTPSSTEDKESNTHEHSRKKRKHSSTVNSSDIREDADAGTPRKVSKHGLFFTPKNNRTLDMHPSQLDPYDSPSTLRPLFSPSQHHAQGTSSSPLPLRAAIGPTPQRDGKALGLFDLLSPSSKSAAATPPSSAKRRRPSLHPQTPSKQKQAEPSLPGEEHDDTEVVRIRRHSITPASSAKKFYLANFFATPTTLRYANANAANGAGNSRAEQTPRSKALLESETPSFLRRRNFSSFNSSNRGINGAKASNDLSPVAVRMPPKLVGKGLSQIVQGLRDMEDERLDEDMDMLREIEAEAEAQAQAQAGGDDDVLVADSQVPGDATTPTRPRWKKKGQKRTTRRVNMRPVRANPKPEPEWKVLEDVSEDEIGSAVQETQVADEQGDDGVGDDDGLEYENELEPVSEAGSTYEDDGEAGKQSSNPALSVVVNKNQTAKAAKDVSEKDKDKDQDMETGKKKVGRPRKVKAEAHANYRALKIRNKGSKGRGRFGRRGR